MNSSFTDNKDKVTENIFLSITIDFKEKTMYDEAEAIYQDKNKKLLAQSLRD